jgi:hypothetical protein
VIPRGTQDIELTIWNLDAPLASSTRPTTSGLHGEMHVLICSNQQQYTRVSSSNNISNIIVIIVTSSSTTAATT